MTVGRSPSRLFQIVGDAAERAPDQAAFRCRGEEITYSELHERSTQLANALRHAGVGPGDLVGIHMGRAIENAVAVYGIQRAGAAYVPLDPTAPLARTDQILRDCRIRHVVTDETRANRLAKLAGAGNELTHLFGVTGSQLRGQSPLIAVGWDEIDQGPSQVFATTPDPSDLAYIIYTSGSTGIPKGIMHTHQSGLAYAQMAASLYDIQPEDRLSSFPPLHFDQSIFDFFSGPLAGATTVIIDEEHQMVPASLAQLIEAERLTVWYSVPLVLVQLLKYGLLDERDHSSLRWVIYGGEPFPLKHLEALMGVWPHARFSNCYGPAETNQCTYHHVDAADVAEASAGSIPIGKPCEGAAVLVVDGDDRTLADGQSGELLVATPTMMAGYWNQPEVTQAAIVDLADPATGSIRTFYRTGDTVRYRDDGLLEFHGRKDRQVKVRGVRVELDEVEAVLLSHKSVDEVAVYPVIHSEETTVHADLTLCVGAEPNASEIRSHSMIFLPRAAVPTVINIRSAFPRTTTGKVDYQALIGAAS